MCGPVGAGLTGGKKYADGRMPRERVAEGRLASARTGVHRDPYSSGIHSASQTGALDLKRRGLWFPPDIPGSVAEACFLLLACCRPYPSVFFRSCTLCPPERPYRAPTRLSLSSPSCLLPQTLPLQMRSITCAYPHIVPRT